MSTISSHRGKVARPVVPMTEKPKQHEVEESLSLRPEPRLTSYMGLISRLVLINFLRVIARLTQDMQCI